MSKKHGEYKVELASTATSDIVRYGRTELNVSVVDGTLVFQERGLLGRVTHVYAPGTWKSAKLVEAESAGE